MPRKPTPEGEALEILREALDLGLEQAGRAAGVSGKVISNLEQGWQTLSRGRLEEILASLGLPPRAADMAGAFRRWVRASVSRPGDDPVDEDDRRAVRAAGEIGLDAAEAALPAVVRQTRAARIRRDRRRASNRWAILSRLSPKARREMIEDAEDYQTWAMCELLCNESVLAAADSASEAVALAELAVLAARLSPGKPARRARLEGWAMAHLGNAQRVSNDLDAADLAFGRSEELWKAGAEDDFLPLSEGRLLDLKASLRREQRRFPESIVLLDQALQASPEAAGRILLNKAATWEQMGEVEQAVETLRRARPHVEENGDERDLFGLLFNLTVSVIHLGEAAEAEALLREVWGLAARLGLQLHHLRTRWLGARVDSLLCRIEEAVVALEQVRGDFLTLEHPYDAGLAGLDLSLLYLKQGRTAEVMGLAGWLEKVFRCLRIDREALASLLLFCDAARREQATVESARRAIGILEAARS
ncbi:MAG TPA: helix-turn-helix transcriptional regulator [Thermoanaerobaculia bacterium]|nr:helix-turn-helix transcriptional regulator [Thermoanaerobaculia bacterium]